MIYIFLIKRPRGDPDLFHFKLLVFPIYFLLRRYASAPSPANNKVAPLASGKMRLTPVCCRTPLGVSSVSVVTSEGVPSPGFPASPDSPESPELSPFSRSS